MSVVRYTFDVVGPLACPDRGAGPAGIAIDSFHAGRDAAAIRALVDDCRDSRGGMASGLNAPGLLGECSPRPGRDVLVSLARIDGVQPAGMVTLTVAGSGESRRFSIGWLVVSPVARRRGVATALVHHALTQARHAGAAVVHVETRESWADAEAFWRSLDGRCRRQD